MDELVDVFGVDIGVPLWFAEFVAFGPVLDRVVVVFDAFAESSEVVAGDDAEALWEGIVLDEGREFFDDGLGRKGIWRESGFVECDPDGVFDFEIQLGGCGFEALEGFEGFGVVCGVGVDAEDCFECLEMVGGEVECAFAFDEGAFVFASGLERHGEADSGVVVFRIELGGALSGGDGFVAASHLVVAAAEEIEDERVFGVFFGEGDEAVENIGSVPGFDLLRGVVQLLAELGLHWFFGLLGHVCFGLLVCLVCSGGELLRV